MRTNNLNRQSFVLTGAMNKVRRDIISDIEENGGIYHSKLTGRTTYLVTNSTTMTRKRQDAERNGTKIITEDDLYRMIQTGLTVNGTRTTNEVVSNSRKLEAEGTVGGAFILTIED